MTSPKTHHWGAGDMHEALQLGWNLRMHQEFMPYATAYPHEVEHDLPLSRRIKIAWGRITTGAKAGNPTAMKAYGIVIALRLSNDPPKWMKYIS